MGEEDHSGLHEAAAQQHEEAAAAAAATGEGPSATERLISLCAYNLSHSGGIFYFFSVLCLWKSPHVCLSVGWSRGKGACDDSHINNAQ